MCGQQEGIQLNLSGLALECANPLTTHVRFLHRDGIEGSISLTYKPGEASGAQEILSTLLGMSKITEQSCFTTVVADHRGLYAGGT